LRSSLRAASASRTAEADYVTPGGEPRIWRFTISPYSRLRARRWVRQCCSTDKTEFASIQRQQELRGEMSGEMALALRNSLAYDFELRAATGRESRLEIGAAVGG